MIECIAIDDEPLALVVIEEFCRQQPNLHLARTFTSTEEAARYLKKFPVDLLFLDIQMPFNGLEFYKRHGGDRMVIFTTAYSEFAVEGFNVDAIDYLLKPIERERFDLAVRRAWDYHQFKKQTSAAHHSLFVRSEYRLVRINLDEVRYIETMDDYLKIHLETQDKPVLTKMNVKNLMEKLDGREFVRIHRSYVVPLRKVLSVRSRTVQLQGIELPIGARYESDFNKAYGAS